MSTKQRTSTIFYECKATDCNVTIRHAPGDRRRKRFCSDSCRQRAYRQKHGGRARSNRPGAEWALLASIVAAYDEGKTEVLSRRIEAARVLLDSKDE